MEYVNIVLIICVIVSGVVSIATIVSNYIQKKKEEKANAISLFDVVAGIVKIVIDTVKKSIDLSNINEDDFKSKDDFIDYVADEVSDTLTEIFKVNNVYEYCTIVFKDDDIKNIIKIIIKQNEEKLGIENMWNK